MNSSKNIRKICKYIERYKPSIYVYLSKTFPDLIWSIIIIIRVADLITVKGLIDLILKDKNPDLNLRGHILASIESTEILDYLFEAYQDEFFEQKNNNWQYISNLQVIEHYEKLMTSLQRTFGFLYIHNQTRLAKHSNDSFRLELLRRALLNPSLYISPYTQDHFPLYFGNTKFKKMVPIEK
ncbi:hypothetical protein DICPUDRAFT_84548 [Dictyostelium purpureum]|uniref:Uncharacterized protein n=1 Tax=Dictyostelium purpureum TaxID=5786 RepID=F1A2Z8_DICPU|nr:uncharacterized protein DICPUDRAFT_84548 [Dictyostelium purpureum]EGC29431.1 hypothetical protein DICPUDRAFT_84548 [Dictyostelium purpureum]|eukprot:XP_003294042.1 hypothetical protein DICPUDRAFT_84548 [Dictyostelium purpureum]